MILRNPKLKLNDLVHALERFGPRYKAFAVFADDLLEARSAEIVPSLRAIDEGVRYELVADGEYAGRRYAVNVSPQWGTVEMSRATTQELRQDQPSPGLTGDPATKAVAEAQRLRGGAANDDQTLGLLTGELFSAGPGASRRVFTLRFEPSLGVWTVYDGGLVPWMKEHLLARSA